MKRPERTCLACRRRRPKDDLLRIARSPKGPVSVDPSGSAEGRGAYVCRDDEGCREAVTRKGAVSRALRLALSAEDLARLRRQIEEESVRI